MLVGEWEQLDDSKPPKYYRKRQVYRDMPWLDEDGTSLNLDKYVICGAPYGGPIAMVRDERKIVELTSSERNRMRIFTAAGKLLSNWPWEHHGLVKLGWVGSEELAAVFVDGSVYVYNIW